MALRVAALALLLTSLPACTLEFPPELVPCSQLAGRTTDLAPDAPALPALGERIVDPTFHTCVTRISDATLDQDIPDEPRASDVSLDEDGLVAPGGSVTAFSTQGYRLYAYDVTTPGRGAPTPTFAGYAVGFDVASPPALLTVDQEELAFVRYVLETGTFSSVSSFAAGLPYTPDGLRGSARSLSADGGRALLSIRLGSRYDVAVLDLATGALVGAHPDVAGESLLTPSGRWVVQTDSASWHLFPADFSNEGIEVPAGRTLSDADTFVLAGGHDGLAIVDGTQLVVFDLDVSPSTEVARAPLVDPGFLGSIEFEARIDGGAVDRPGWLVLSVSECASGSPMCSDASSWARPKIALVGVGGSELEIHDLAWHYGGSSVHAVPSRDLARVVFTSDWGGSGPVEAYVVEVPTAQLRLPGS